jgi:hypothetical protein
MDATLPPLESMRDNLLKDCIGPIYGYDPSVPGSDALYNTRVRVLNMQNIQGGVIIWNYSERFVQCLATSKNFNRTADATVNQVLNLTFADESDPYGNGLAFDPFDPNLITAQYITDITTLRSNLAAFPGIKGVAFQVNTGPNAYPGFRGLTQATFVDTGVYAPNNNISDLNQFTYELDVTAQSTPEYYLAQVTNGLTTLGFTVNCNTVPTITSTLFYAVQNNTTSYYITTASTDLDAKCIVETYHINLAWALIGEPRKSFVNIAVGVQLYTFSNTIYLGTVRFLIDTFATPTPGFLPNNRYIIHTTSGVVDSITNFTDLPTCP